MNKIMKYSVLRYSPSKIAGERINLGIIFESENEEYRAFKFIKKFKRLTEFDDEINIDSVKLLLNSIREDVEGTLISREFCFEEYIKFFVNDYYFDELRQIEYESVSEVVDLLYKTYFRFDLEKKERLNINEDKKMIARVLSGNGINKRKENWIYGDYNDKITYDFITDDYCIKVFDFDNKDLSRIVNNVKAWAWNAEHLSQKEFVLIYRYSEEKNSCEFKTIFEILKSSGAKVLDIEAGIQLLQN